MYLSVIGKRLVACINERDGTEYTIREFFDEVFVPLFFGNQRFLLNIGNSPFYQKVTVQKLPFTTALLKECIEETHRKVASQVQNQEIDMSIFLGGPASGSLETTSGQVTDMKLPIHEDEVLASWIGAAAGIMIQGGISLALDQKEILIRLFEGWMQYRDYLEQTPSMKPLKVNAWNGQWLTHSFGKDAAYHFVPTPTAAGDALETEGWVQLLFALSYHFQDEQLDQLPAYVYALGQSNSTMGFVRLNLAEVRRPVELFRQLFTVPEGMHPKDFESLYNTEFSFRRVCETPDIGLKAIKPKDVFKGQYEVPKPPKQDEAEKRLAFDTYQTWIIAMLNNKDLLQRAEDLSLAFLQFERKDVRGRVIYKQKVQDVLNTRHRREFIEHLTPLVEQDPDHCDLYTQTVTDLLNLSQENVTLFLTLLRFQYAATSVKQ